MRASSSSYFIFSPLESGSGGDFSPKPVDSVPAVDAGNKALGQKERLDSKGKKNKLPEVLVVRNWKEYAGESLMIIFSVLLALLLTEIFNKIHENQQTHEILAAVRQEILDNKMKEDTQYLYHLQILKNINSALDNSEIAQKFIHNGEVDSNLRPIAPLGIISADLNDVAWQVAKQFNIFSKIDFNTYSLLTDIYNNQDRITKSEEEIARVILSWESRKPENLRLTLILIRDNYHAWAVDRAPALLQKYEHAIQKLSNY
jgi:hypothetical protein